MISAGQYMGNNIIIQHPASTATFETFIKYIPGSWELKYKTKGVLIFQIDTHIFIYLDEPFTWESLSADVKQALILCFIK